MRFLSIALTLLVASLSIAGCTYPVPRVVTNVEYDGSGGFRMTKCTVFGSSYGGRRVGDCHTEFGVSDVVYVPLPKGGERTVNPAKVCEVLRRHAGEFVPYWKEARAGAATTATEPTERQFDDLCIALPLALKRCTYEPYRRVNAARCTSVFRAATANDLEKLDALYLADRGPQSKARTGGETEPGEHPRVIGW